MKFAPILTDIVVG